MARRRKAVRRRAPVRRRGRGFASRFGKAVRGSFRPLISVQVRRPGRGIWSKAKKAAKIAALAGSAYMLGKRAHNAYTRANKLMDVAGNWRPGMKLPTV